MKHNLTLTPRTAASALIAGSVLATATVATANVVRPVVRPGVSAVKPNAVKTGTATNLFAGGATLPAIAYEGTAAAAQAPGVTSKSGTVGSAFYYFITAVSSNRSTATPDTISYCQTGSGFGKKVLGQNDFSAATQPAPLSAANACPAIGVKPTDSNGFGASNGQKFADFVGSDAPLSQSEFNNVKTYSGRGQAVQTPVIAGSVAMFFNNPDITTQKSISDATLCKIAAGKITNWNQIPDFTAPSRALSFVYRSDGSGTSFSFSNHLNAVCASTLGSSSNFGVSQNFKYVAPATSGGSSSDVGAFPGPTSPVGTLPANFVGASGNPGIIASVSANPGYIGYTEAANAKPSLNASKGIGYLQIGGRDPYAGLPVAANAIPTSAVLINQQIPAPTSYGQAANPVALSGATNSCVVTIKPSAYANLAASSTSNAYPIVAVTNLEFTTAGNGAESSDLQLLPQMFYTGGGKAVSNYGSGKITTVDAAGTTPTSGTGTGFSSLPLGTASGSIGAAVATATKCIGS